MGSTKQDPAPTPKPLDKNPEPETLKKREIGRNRH
jgi:hypothetical protein